jgi:hypothetical protein
MRLWFITAWLALATVCSAVTVAERFNENSLALEIASFLLSVVFLLYSAALGLGLGIAKVVRLVR